jgi:hypothetical protein
MDNPAQGAYRATVKGAGLPAEFDWHSLRHYARFRIMLS